MGLEIVSLWSTRCFERRNVLLSLDEQLLNDLAEHALFGRGALAAGSSHREEQAGFRSRA